MNALVIDDEKRARKTLIQMAKLCCPDILSFSEADSVQEGIIAIKANKPDILFLDINLGDGTGFDVLSELEEMQLHVIFVTAHNEYALKALKASAIDYLLKPLKSTELIAAVHKVKQRLNKNNLSPQIGALLLNLQNNTPEKGVTKIIVKTLESVYIINVNEIVFCQSDKGYTTFQLLDNRTILSSKILAEYEAILPTQSFMRIHQSFLVNLHHIVRYDKKDKNNLVTIGDYKLPVAARRKEMLMKYLDKLAQ